MMDANAVNDDANLGTFTLSLWTDSCHHIHPTKSTSIGYCLALSFFFVLSLYIFLPPRVRLLARNDIRQIKWRLFAVALFSFLSILSYPFCPKTHDHVDGGEEELTTKLYYLGWSFNGGVIPVLLHTMSLFLGPMVAEIFEMHVAAEARFDARSRQHGWRSRSSGAITTSSRSSTYAAVLFSRLEHLGSDLLTWGRCRDYVAAPFVEEVVFRGCMAPPLLASGFTPGQVSVLAPLFFGTAHVHHAILKLRSGSYSLVNVVLSTLFQFAYTSLFGTYATYAFIRTGSVLAVTLSHTFCNIMGLPDLRFLWREDGAAAATSSIYPYRHIILLAYAAGIYLFVAGFFDELLFGFGTSNEYIMTLMERT